MEVEDTDGIDRISSLPEEVLGKVLSLLPTKYAVATSVLSRRWRHLFKLITHFDFDDSTLFNPPHVANFATDFSLFKDFVRRVLALSSSPNKHNFSLKCYGLGASIDSISDTAYSSVDINALMSYALAHNFKEIDVLFHATKYFDLPHVLEPNLFHHQGLELLKLDGNFSLVIPESFCLPSLKVVHFNSVEFADSASVNKFFSSCPALEEFSSKANSWKKVEVLDISAPALQRLILQLTNFDFCARDSVVLNCPNLVYFDYSDYLALHYSIVNFQAISEAIVNVAELEDAIGEGDLVNLLTGLSNVTQLSLLPPWMEGYTLPVFLNLTKLSILYDFQGDEFLWGSVFFTLLDASPVLETLIFPMGLGFGGIDYEENTLMSSFQRELRNHTVPSCLSNTVKAVEVHCFKGLEEEFEVIKYFLSNVQVLEELILYCMRPMNAAEEELVHSSMRTNKCSITFLVEDV